MKIRILSVLSLAALGGLLSHTALGGGVVRKPLPAEQFVAKALAAGIAEVKLSESAAKNAANADVRRFAQKLVEDHKKCNSELLEIAKDMKLAVVSGLDKTFQERINQITSLEGAKFDRAYMKHQVEAHEQAIQLFEAQAKDTNNRLKTFAEKALPTLRAHLKEAREIRAKVDSGS
ncbi:MAG: DUF4142 domain-containing protein [Gemmataceae bacterium]|nr:DUF4142 domain-containing protein [Gemmataceae bacterium]